ncbi:hypothetical protein FRC17_007443 [Serendipita sp. 399]|nr:hypothetical protein FRC17_007443 [Serendipita sp. 399]
MEYRSGSGGTRTWTINRGDGPAMTGHPLGFPPNVPGFPEFLQQMHTPPRNTLDDDAGSPFGARRRPEGQAPEEMIDPREFLMQYLIGVLSGDPTLMFERRDGQFQGGGAFGDYVFSQEGIIGPSNPNLRAKVTYIGLDRIMSQLMEAAGQNKPNPAPEEVIANLKRTNLTYESDLVKSGQSCAICTEYFAPPETQASSTEYKAPQPDENSGPSSGVAITLPCGHPFHDDCIITWLKANGTCPVCRYALVEQPSSSGENGAQRPVPGAASTSSNPPNPQPQAAAPPPRPQPERNQTSESTTSNSTTTLHPPEAQADAVFRTLGGPGAVLDSFLGFVTGRGHGRGNSSGSARSGRTEASSSGASPDMNSSSRTRERDAGSSSQSSPRPRSPPYFFRDQRDRRHNNNGSNSRGNDSSRQNHEGARWTDID